MDLNALLNPELQDREVENHILGNMLQTMAQADVNLQKQNNIDAMNRINTSQAAGNYAGQGGGSRNAVKASLDEKGQVTLTNIGTSPTTQAGSIVGDSDTVRLTTSNIDAKIKGIAGYNNSTDATIALTQLESDFTALKTNAFSQALKNAQIANHVPELQAQLNRLHALDAKAAQQNPDKFSGPSQETLATTQLLDRSRKSAEDMAQSALSTDVGLNALGAKVVGAKKTLDVFVSKSMQKELNADAKQAMQDTEMQQRIASTPDEILNRVKKINPQFSDTDVINYLDTGAKKNPAEYAALIAPPTAIPDMAFVSKNETALKLLGEQEMAATGKSSQEVSQEIKNIEVLMNDTNILKQKALRVYGGKDSEGFQNIVKALSPDTVLATMKPAEREELKRVRFQVAKSILSKEAEDKFLGDVSTWQAPELTEAVSKTAGLKLPITLENVAQQYVGDLIGTARNAKVNELAGIMRRVTKSQMNSTLTSFDPEVSINRLGAFTAMPTAWDAIRKSIATVGTEAMNSPISRIAPVVPLASFF